MKEINWGQGRQVSLPLHGHLSLQLPKEDTQILLAVTILLLSVIIFSLENHCYFHCHILTVVALTVLSCIYHNLQPTAQIIPHNPFLPRSWRSVRMQDWPSPLGCQTSTAGSWRWSSTSRDSSTSLSATRWAPLAFSPFGSSCPSSCPVAKYLFVLSHLSLWSRRLSREQSFCQERHEDFLFVPCLEKY